MELQVGVKVLLNNLEGKYLILKRSKEKYSGMVGWWDLPGGRIEPGMTLVDNLRREVKEETGLIIAGDPSLLMVQDILRQAGRHVVRITYAASVSGEPVLTSEHTEYAWRTMDELLEHSDMDIYAREMLEKRIA